MTRSGDIVRIARQRAGLTQQQVADRSGYPRETIARWEAGSREPSLSSLQDLVQSLDLDLVVQLAPRDESLLAAVDDQLALSPRQRLQRLLPRGAADDALKALRWVANARTPTIVIGSVGAVLEGGPQRPRSGRVDFVSADPYASDLELRAAGSTPIDADERWADLDVRAPWDLRQGGTVALASNVPGTDDYRDLRRHAVAVDLGRGTTVEDAHPRDLLRMAEASPRESERAQVPGLRALLERLNGA